MVNLEWYRTFKAVYQYGTLTRAAQELMISQPNVSIQLAALENYIGSPLFIRTPRKMIPTECGKLLYTHIVESIDNLERVETEFKRTVINKQPSLRIGSPIEIFNNYLAQHIGELVDFHLMVEYGLADELIEKLINDRLDIAIITRQAKTKNDLTYDPLFTEKLMIVCSPDIETSEFDRYTESKDYVRAEKWLKSQRWYAYSNDLALIRRFWRENFKKRPILKLNAIMPDYHSILKAVSNSDCLAVSSDFIAGKALLDKSIKILWNGVASTTNTVYLAYNKNKISPFDVERFTLFLKKHINITNE